MNWISVKEQLPNLKTHCLIYDQTNKQINSAIYEYDWKICGECSDFCSRYDVTHWMPLPPPPHSQKCESKCLRCGN